MGSDLLVVCVPMAGLGSRFSSVGFKRCKPFININGLPMIWHVLKNLSILDDNIEFQLVAQEKDFDTNQIAAESLAADFSVKWTLLNGTTDGTARTVALGLEQRLPSEELIVANSDQIITGKLRDFLIDARRRSLAGSILTFRDEEKNPKWSFARLNDDNLVEEVAEKKPISDIATVGIYWFSSVGCFTQACNEMFTAEDKVNNEFYTAPVYNYLVKACERVGVFNIPPENMHGLGTPEDLAKYCVKKGLSYEK